MAFACEWGRLFTWKSVSGSDHRMPKTNLSLRGRPELSSLSRECTGYAGGEGVKSRCTLFKMLIMIGFSHEVVKNQHFQSTLLEGREGVTKQSTLCALLIMLIILDDPLSEDTERLDAHGVPGVPLGFEKL